MQASIDIPESSFEPEHHDEPDHRTGVLGPVMSSLGWPIVFGLVGFWAFLFCLEQEWIKSELLVRYLNAHPVSYVATAMFFVGVASLGLKLCNVLVQVIDKPNVSLSPAPALAQRADASRHLLEEMEDWSHGRQESYLGRRLRHALEFVDKSESANGLEDELKYLAETDAEQQQESFALTRILIWAIPMLGFLGTVIGISGALGGLSIESDFSMMLSGLKEQLYVAFDTTALALTLSIVLMFAQFIVNRFETQLLSSVDHMAVEQLSGRFETIGSHRDPFLASVENMSNRVLDSIATANAQQSEVWKQGLTAIQSTTDDSLGKFAGILADRLTTQLEPIMDEFGVTLRKAIADSTACLDSHAEKLASAMDASVETMHQKNLDLAATVQQGTEILHRALVAHAEGINQSMTASDESVQTRLLQMQEVMKETITLVADQTRQLALGIENSHELIRANSDSVQQSIESANQFLSHHTSKLGEVVVASSKGLEEHAAKISEAVTRSEEIVDKRQETIFQTQQSMLKAQSQQSMAISAFTEKLRALEEIVEKSGSLESMQHTLNETLATLEKSDTIASELGGLARVVEEQVKSVDRAQLSQAQSNEKQLAAMISHTNEIFNRNSELLDHYQQKIDDLTKQLIQLNSKPQDNSQTTITDNLQTLTMQLVNQNQSLAVLTDHFKQSFDLDSLSHKLALAYQNVASEHNQGPAVSPQMEETVQSLASSINVLNQSLKKQAERITESRIDMGQPDTPKRVA